jgi:hypothetical protein
MGPTEDGSRRAWRESGRARRQVGRMERGAGLLTVLFPAPVRVLGDPLIGQALALSVEGAEWCDDVVAVPSRVDADGNKSAPGLTISRRRNGAVVEQRSVGRHVLQDPGSRIPGPGIAASPSPAGATQGGQ